MEKLFPGRIALFAGRATAAIFAVLKALKLPRRSEVVVPATCCPNVALAVKWSGLRPILCDTRLDDMTMDVGSLRTLITPRTRAIIPVHLFGHPCDMRPILEVADRCSAIVIEDCAQSLGSRLEGRMTGAFGEVSVFSFGHKKTVDAGGGSAILLRDQSLADRIRGELARMPPFSRRFDRSFKEYRREYYAMTPCARIGRRRLMALHRKYRRMYFYRMDRRFGEKLLPLLKTLRSNLARRRRIARYYHTRLRRIAGLLRPRAGKGATPWRYSFLCQAQERLTSHLRKHGIPVSTLYPSLTNEFDTRRKAMNARRMEGRIVNLMTDASREDARRTVALIRGLLAPAKKRVQALPSRRA